MSARNLKLIPTNPTPSLTRGTYPFLPSSSVLQVHGQTVAFSRQELSIWIVYFTCEYRMRACLTRLLIKPYTCSHAISVCMRSRGNRGLFSLWICKLERIKESLWGIRRQIETDGSPWWRQPPLSEHNRLVLPVIITMEISIHGLICNWWKADPDGQPWNPAPQPLTPLLTWGKILLKWVIARIHISDDCAMGMR